MLNKFILSFKKNASNIILLFLFLTAVCGNFIKQGVICNDEVLLRIWRQKGFATFFKETIIDANINQGRILGLVGNLKFLGYLSTNHYIFRSIQLLFLLTAVCLMGYFTYRILNNKYFSFVLVTLLISFLPITFELAVPNAHVIVCVQPLILLLFSLIWFLNFNEYHKKKYLVLSLIMYIWALCLYEFIITYVLLFPIIYFVKYQSENNLFSAVVLSIKKTYAYFVGAVCYLIAYVLQGKLFPTSYSGNSFYLGSLTKIINVLKTECLSSLPGYYLYDPKHHFLYNYYNQEPSIVGSIFKMEIIVFGTILAYALMSFYTKEHLPGKSKFKGLALIIVSFAYTIIPTLPNSLTKLYQNGVEEGYFISIPVSIFLYFSMMLCLLYVIWKIAEYLPFTRYIFIAVIVIFGIRVQIENSVFAQEQESNYERFTSIEALFRQSYWGQFQGQEICAPSLYETRNTLAIEDGHWSQYASIYGNNVQVSNNYVDEEPCIVIQDNNDFYFHNSESDWIISKDAPDSTIFIMDSNDNYIKAVLTGNKYEDSEFTFYEVSIQ